MKQHESISNLILADIRRCEGKTQNEYQFGEYAMIREPCIEDINHIKIYNMLFSIVNARLMRSGLKRKFRRNEFSFKYEKIVKRSRCFAFADPLDPYSTVACRCTVVRKGKAFRKESEKMRYIPAETQDQNSFRYEGFGIKEVTHEN